MTAEVAAALAVNDPPVTDSDGFVRLHISPLDADLLKVVVPSSALPSARNISFHTIETFPERRYGFVELPQEDADKLKRKLNGTTLKGCKMRIEKARPLEAVDDVQLDDRAERKRKRREKKEQEKAAAAEAGDGLSISKKRKRDVDVLQGVAITDRKVKRGWTDPNEPKKKRSKKDKDSKDKEKDNDSGKKPKSKEKEKKKRLKSKYTEQEECLLKTKVPANAVKNLSPGDVPKKKGKKGGKVRGVTVHEFEKTTKFPSFLKAAVSEAESKAAAAEYVEGKGWVDEEGNVVEEVKEKVRPEKTKKEKKKKSKAPEPEPVVESEPESDEGSDTSSSGTSSSGSDDESADSDIEQPAATTATPQKRRARASSPSRARSSSADSAAKPPATAATPVSALKADPSSRPMSSSSSTRDLTIKIPPPLTSQPTTPSASKIHPLEALYKRAKPAGDDNSATATAQTPGGAAAAAAAEPFSFFGGDLGSDMEEDADEPATLALPVPPMTPFTKQDFEWRNIRSAAPTPDTAHPSRMHNFWASQEENGDGGVDEDMEDLDQDLEENGAEPVVLDPAADKSDFQTWFWANRSQLNRSWMQRRKTATKEKRHRENKARASKAV